MDSIPPGFLAITCERLSKWLQNCAYISEIHSANVVGQRRESFLHKVKIILETWEVNKKLMKNS